MHNAVISVRLGERWNSLSKTEQQPYRNESRRLRDLHRQQHPDYKYRPRKRVVQRAKDIKALAVYPNKFKRKASKTNTVRQSPSERLIPECTASVDNWYDNYDCDADSAVSGLLGSEAPVEPLSNPPASPYRWVSDARARSKEHIRPPDSTAGLHTVSDPGDLYDALDPHVGTQFVHTHLDLDSTMILQEVDLGNSLSLDLNFSL